MKRIWRRQWQPTPSCLENPMDEGAWWAAVHGVAKSQTRLKRLSSSISSMKKMQSHRDMELGKGGEF